MVPEDRVGDAAIKHVASIGPLSADIVDKIHSYQYKIISEALNTNKSVEVTKFFHMKIIEKTVFKMVANFINRKEGLEYILIRDKDKMSERQQLKMTKLIDFLKEQITEFNNAL
jgi:hypothetical protein